MCSSFGRKPRPWKDYGTRESLALAGLESSNFTWVSNVLVCLTTPNSMHFDPFGDLSSRKPNSFARRILVVTETISANFCSLRFPTFELK